ncbi:MFS transporter [Lactiplantibacillus plantarum]|uniref:MFS transporter n=1 Tax=Lactiplantibacillus plantarum 2025 TaxID=1385856 RepID=A0A837NKE2_LACPN|nr:MFS transporter [Lactiplantibacillus plantarum]AGL64043.2 Transporter protein [Lactiplantibacillus plantarum subsp. plantarum P-8]AGO07988.1 drug resistance transport protein, major facilitator superfamily (MFS), EmrB/QacA subfamily [Lactiplantibacillus plantarum 16]ANJ13394.1 MFS transporter [Lactiplantibacillus plantarum]APB85215.1 MFS transporter [Lactiplantibacillus plantarum]AQY72081.1 MFS transporter [Lactiplantibacillus plantarum]
MMKKSTKVIAMMMIGIFLCMLDTTVMNIALPAIQTGLNTDLTHLSWALNIYTVLFASLAIPLGRLADVWGRGRMYLIGLGLFGIGSLTSGLSLSVGLLITGRAIQSIGAAIVFPASMTIGIQSVALSRHTGVIASLGVMQGLAAALGPTIGGAVTQFWGWRGIFLINVPLVAVALCGCIAWLSWRHPSHGQVKLDLGGSALVMTTLLALTLVLVKGNDWGWTSRVVLSLGVTSALTLIAFVWMEAHVSAPMVPLALFKDRQFNGAALATVLSGVFMVGLLVLMPSFFTKVQSKTELMAAIMITPASMMIFIFSPISGFLLAKLGARRVIFSGSLAIATGYGVLSLMSPSQYWQFALAALLVGAGYGTIIGPITVLAAGDFTGELLTASQSVIGVFRQIGTSLAVAIFVSALAANLTTAKTQIRTYATTTVTTLSIPKQAKRDTLRVVDHQLATEQTAQTVHEPITAAKARRLVAANYMQVLKARSLQSAPVRIKAQIHQQVAQKVHSQVKHTNQRIRTAASAIKAKAKIELTAAFMRPYQVAWPFTLLLVMTTWCFAGRERKSGKPS